MHKQSLGYYQETTALSAAIGLHKPGVTPAAISGATNATPIVVTSNNHGLATGATMTIEAVGGNTAANGNWLVTVIDGNNFSLKGSAGNGNYTNGGTWRQLPGGVMWVLLSAEVANVRWTDDGTLPNASTGFLLKTSDPPYLFDGDPTKLHFIAAANGAVLNVNFYKSVT